MKTPVDWNDVAALEKAISDKYGPEAAMNPKSLWTPEKEEDYRKQLKEQASKEQKKSRQIKLEDINKHGELVKVAKRTCDVCRFFSWEIRDDLYMSRFGVCYRCFVQYIDGREERWKEGWRPDGNCK